MGEGQNVPAPTEGFFIPRTAIFQRIASFRLAYVTVQGGAGVSVAEFAVKNTHTKMFGQSGFITS